MNTPTRMAAFAAGLAAVFAVSVGVGNAVGPIGKAEADAAKTGGDSHGGDAHGGDAKSPAVPALPAGISASQNGYLLELAEPILQPGRQTDFAFQVTTADGALDRYTPSHDKELHLIVARRDLATFQHVHPTRDAKGRWSVPLTLADPGPYKVYADFVPEGSDKAVILAADVTVPGAYTPAPRSASSTAVVDGYTVTLSGDLVPGTSSELRLSVAKDGQPVSDLEPYLAAYGHLVALRSSDLAYLHVHPEGEPGDGSTPAGPEITFFVEVPTTGEYGLFLDFQHRGVVRTAAFTVSAHDAPGHDEGTS